MRYALTASLFLFLSAWAKGDTVIVFTNNVNDLNAQRDEISAVAGVPLRITAVLNDGVDPLDMSTATFPITLTMYHRTDNYINRVVTSIDGTISNNFARWRWNLDYPGAYLIQARAFYPDDDFLIVDRWLSVTSAPSVAAQVTANITNVVQSTLIINVEGNTVAEIVQP